MACDQCFRPAPHCACGGYVPVLERNHNPTAHDEMLRMLDECARLGKENAALRSLLREWYELFALGCLEGTEGARLLDRTAEVMTLELRYKTPKVKVTGIAPKGEDHVRMRELPART